MLPIHNFIRTQDFLTDSRLTWGRGGHRGPPLQFPDLVRDAVKEILQILKDSNT
jgi:hypothetical protein